MKFLALVTTATLLTFSYRYTGAKSNTWELQAGLGVVI